MASSNLLSPKSFTLHRDQSLAAISYDPCAGIKFSPALGSDDLFEALKLAFPRGKNHRSRIREAVIEFLISEREAERSQSRSQEVERKAQGTAESCPRKADLAISCNTALHYLTVEGPSKETGIASPPSEAGPSFRSSADPSVTTAHSPKMTVSDLTIVWSSVDGMAQKPRTKRAMSDQELEEYRLRRTLGACRICKVKKRKCTHNTPQVTVTEDLAPQPLQDNSTPRDSLGSTEETEMHEKISECLPETHIPEHTSSILGNDLRCRKKNRHNTFLSTPKDPYFIAQTYSKSDPNTELPGINKQLQEKALTYQISSAECSQVDTWDDFVVDTPQSSFMPELEGLGEAPLRTYNANHATFSPLPSVPPMVETILPLNYHSLSHLAAGVVLPGTKAPDLTLSVTDFRNISIPRLADKNIYNRCRSRPTVSKNLPTLFQDSGRYSTSISYPAHHSQTIKEIGFLEETRSAAVQVSDEMIPTPSKDPLDDVYLVDPLDNRLYLCFSPPPLYSAGDRPLSYDSSSNYLGSYTLEPITTDSAKREGTSQLRRHAAQKVALSEYSSLFTMHNNNPKIHGSQFQDDPLAPIGNSTVASTAFPAYEVQLSMALGSACVVC